MQKYDIAVSGAGASGLAAAVEAARAGATVLALEKNHVPGRKILSTGSGKCNFSNAAVTPAAYHPGPASFLKKTFAALPPREVLSFFEELGLLWTADERGRLFPNSFKAQDVSGVLLNELGSRGVELRTLTEVSAVTPGKDGFALEAFRVPPQWDKKSARGERLAFQAGRVILAAGGPAYPQIGGTSGGSALLRALGHKVSPLSPAIVPLTSGDACVRELDGVRAEALLTLRAGGKNLASAPGELLFTSYGVSGPAVLDLSRAALAALGKAAVSIEADFFPSLKPDALRRLLESRAKRFAARPFGHFACGLLNEKLLKAAAARCGISWAAPAGPGRPAFADLLKAFHDGLTGPPGLEDAMVTAGGCSLAEMDPETFASRKVPGLFVTGELLDLDGDSGGFNLHLAWTSGILAGRAAAKK